MSELKLSNIKKDLKKVLKITGWPQYELETVGKPIPYFEMGENPSIDVYPEDFENRIHWKYQALIIAALEQYAESKGYWFENKKNWTSIDESEACVFLCPEEPTAESAVATAPTRLQATLKAFVEVFGNERA